MRAQASVQFIRQRFFTQMVGGGTALEHEAIAGAIFHQQGARGSAQLLHRLQAVH